MTDEKENPNLHIWKAVQTTDPRRTKEFNRGGGFKGTATNPTYLAMRATEIFGPAGKGWGVEVRDEKFMDGAPILNNDGGVICHEVIHIIRVALWYYYDGKRYEVEQFGQTTFVGKNKYGIFTDEEAPKKTLTDGMTKCLSLLGFAADVYLGLYDDSKYVNDLRAAAWKEEAAVKKQAAKCDHGLTPDKNGLLRVPGGESQDDNWKRWGAAFREMVDSRLKTEDLDALLKQHDAPIKNLRIHNANWADHLQKCIDNRRHLLSQGDIQAGGNA